MLEIQFFLFYPVLIDRIGSISWKKNWINSTRKIVQCSSFVPSAFFDANHLHIEQASFIKCKNNMQSFSKFRFFFLLLESFAGYSNWTFFFMQIDKNWFSFSFFSLFLGFRCKSFQTTKRDEFCRIPGSSVLPTASGSPIQIRLPHINASVFRQFILYAYTGKVCYWLNFDLLFDLHVNLFNSIFSSSSSFSSFYRILTKKIFAFFGHANKKTNLDYFPRFTRLWTDDTSSRPRHGGVESCLWRLCGFNIVRNKCMHIFSGGDGNSRKIIK